MEPEPEAPTTLAAVAAEVGAVVGELLKYSEADMGELLKDELGMKVVARNRILEEWRGLRAQSVVVTVQARFAAFLERMGGAQALQGLGNVPISGLSEAVGFIRGHGAPDADELRRGVERALTKADALLAAGPDQWGLSRDEIGAIHFYTDDGLGGAVGSLFRPLNAALRAGERADAKPYWGYIRLLQHALFKLPKDGSGTLYPGLQFCSASLVCFHGLHLTVSRICLPVSEYRVLLWITCTAVCLPVYLPTPRHRVPAAGQ
jgi:hypothetical protein